MTRRTAIWLLIITVIISTGLRLYYLTGRSLWFDEAFSWRLIQFDLPEMLARAATDVHPPLYYIFLKAWASVSSSTILSLRLFSVFWAAVTAAFIYLFTAYATSSRRTGLLAAALFAVSGFQIQYAWEARMYTMGTALVLLSSYLLLKAIRHNKLSWWLAYGITATAFAYVHYFAFFSIAAQAVFALGYYLFHWRHSWRPFIAAALATLLYLPWLPTLLRQNAQVQDSFWIPAIGGWSIPDTFYRMFAPTSGIPGHLGFGPIALAALPLGATLIGWLILAFNRSAAPRDARLLVALSGFIPFVLTIVLSFAGQSLYQDRFFVFTHLFIIIGLAILLASIRSRPVRQSAMLIATLTLLLTFGAYWRELDIPHRGGAQAATKVITDQAAASEPIIVSSPFVFFAVDHYITEQYSGQVAVPKLYSTTGQLSHFSGQPILEQTDVVGPAFLADPSLVSLWVVDTTGFGESPLQLDQTWQADISQSFPEVFPFQQDVLVTRYLKQR